MSRWKPEMAKKVEKFVAEIIDLADSDALDVVRCRQVEQEVLDKRGAGIVTVYSDSHLR